MRKNKSKNKRKKETKMSKLLLGLLLAATAITAATSAQKRETVYLTPENTFIFRGAVDSGSVANALEKLTILVNKRVDENETIYLVLDSPGGSIFAGEQFIQAVKMFKNVKTISIFAASMAHAIAQALPGERLVAENGTMMAHRARGGVSGQIGTGELESQLKYIKSVILFMEKRNANRMDLSIEEYQKRVKDEYWAFGKSAVEEGMADRVVNIECSKDLIKKKIKSQIRTLFGSATVSMSGCPLYPYPIR